MPLTNTHMTYQVMNTIICKNSLYHKTRYIYILSATTDLRSVQKLYKASFHLTNQFTGLTEDLV